MMDIETSKTETTVRPLRVLLVEDSEDDALLLLRELRRGGYELTSERVDTAEAMSNALQSREWDVIVSDYVMPHFSGLAALELYKKTGLDVPFVIVSAKIGEETAVAAMKAGADDYILKGNLARLVPAIEREMREAAVRRERRRAEEALRESEERFRTLTTVSPVGVFLTDSSGECEYVNQRWSEITEVPPDQALGEGCLNAIHPEDREQVASAWSNMKTSLGEWDLEYRLNPNDGKVTWVAGRAKAIRDESGETTGYIGTLSDITERKRAEERQKEFYRSTILAATQGKLVVADRKEIEDVAGQSIASWPLERGDELSDIRHTVTDVGKSLGMDESRIYDFHLAISEAGANALRHAGGGEVTLHKTEDSLIAVISDHGHGIEALSLPDATLRHGYSTAGTLGMGYTAILTVADKVYLATGPDGTSVAIELKLSKEEAEIEFAGLPDTWGKW